MVRLSTRAQIRLARALYLGVRGARRLRGRHSDRVECTRGSVRFRLDLDQGIDLSLYLFGVFERSTRLALRRLTPRGGHVIDVGANVGAHTLFLARDVGPGGRVIAVEPTTWAFEKLEANCALNPGLSARVTRVQALLASATRDGGAAPCFASWRVTGEENVHPIHRGGLRPCDGAEVIALDDLVTRLQLQRVDLIKVDVDGAELEVLQGAAQVLARDRPFLLLELCEYVHRERDRSAADLIELLFAAGYGLADERLRRLPDDAGAIVASIPSGGSRNVVAIPGTATNLPGSASKRPCSTPGTDTGSSSR